MTTKPLWVALSALALMAGCSKKEESAPAAAATPAAAPATTSGPEIVPAAPPAAVPAPTPPPAATPIASQPGIASSTWDLTRAQVVGNILTIQFLVTPAPGKSLIEVGAVKMDQVSMIDDSTSQRYSVLKDDTGRPMASPLESDGEDIRLVISNGTTGVVWFKFPAPPATSASVSLTIPAAGSFDGVKVQR